jgi:hypothetical protein
MTSSKSPSSNNHHHYERRVRLFLRDDEDSHAVDNNRHNLFVRLSSEVAWDLHNQIVSPAPPDLVAETSNDGDLDEHGTFSSPSVDFLPLQITVHDREDGATVYASFNGGTIHCDDSEGTHFQNFVFNCCGGGQ